MRYIEVNSELRNCPQLFELAELLGVPLPEALGVLIDLWLWALDVAPDGDLNRFNSEDIARVLEWDGDAKNLIPALKKSGFLDENNVICARDKYSGELLYRPGE